MLYLCGQIGRLKFTRGGLGRRSPRKRRIVAQYAHNAFNGTPGRQCGPEQAK
jgi:hypothetical protein